LYLNNDYDDVNYIEHNVIQISNCVAHTHL
jgi:hypothetical protein